LSQLPNFFSLLRFLSAPLMGWLILQRRLDLALLVGLAAGVSDLLDGYLARLLHANSRVGAYLDPAADKVLLVVSFVSLGYIGQIPLWLIALVILRDLVIVVGVLLLWRFRGETEFSPLFSGKLSTAFQIATVLAILVGDAFTLKSASSLRIIGVSGTSFFTILSGINYVRKGIRMASSNNRMPRGKRNFQ
jgi:cardiolipin synthase (CMP-forming)